MRVVLDTNVLISGIFFSGPPAAILGAWSAGQLELVASVESPVEYRRVGERPHRKYPSIDIDAVLDLVTYEALLVLPSSLPVTACDDADDVKFLACALAGGAQHVVSGDKALLRASGFRGSR